MCLESERIKRTKTGELVLVRIFPDLLSTPRTGLRLPRSECSLGLPPETGTSSASLPGIVEV